MSGNNVQITSKCIKNSLKKYTSLKSICEYVWNGFDAKATQVIVEASENILGNISFIKVVDNGYGIARNQLDDKSGHSFSPRRYTTRMQSNRMSTAKTVWDD